MTSRYEGMSAKQLSDILKAVRQEIGKYMQILNKRISFSFEYFENVTIL